jgi:hypothetical protein
MIPMAFFTRQNPAFTFRLLHIFAIVLLIVVTAFFVTVPAFAQQGFAMLGTWQSTTKDGVLTVAFNGDGMFTTRSCWPPGPGGTGSGCATWRGKYRATGASSWVSQANTFQSCASGGGCNSCPRSRGDLPGPQNYGCDIMKSMFGISLNTQNNETMKMQGPNQALDTAGRTWRRTR